MGCNAKNLKMLWRTWALKFWKHFYQNDSRSTTLLEINFLKSIVYPNGILSTTKFLPHILWIFMSLLREIVAYLVSVNIFCTFPRAWGLQKLWNIFQDTEKTKSRNNLRNKYLRRAWFCGLYRFWTNQPKIIFAKNSNKFDLQLYKQPKYFMFSLFTVLIC